MISIPISIDGPIWEVIPEIKAWLAENTEGPWIVQPETDEGDGIAIALNPEDMETDDITAFAGEVAKIKKRWSE